MFSVQSCAWISMQGMEVRLGFNGQRRQIGSVATLLGFEEALLLWLRRFQSRGTVWTCLKSNSKTLGGFADVAAGKELTEWARPGSSRSWGRELVELTGRRVGRGPGEAQWERKEGGTREFVMGRREEFFFCLFVSLQLMRRILWIQINWIY